MAVKHVAALAVNFISENRNYFSLANARKMGEIWSFNIAGICLLSLLMAVYELRSE